MESVVAILQQFQILQALGIWEAGDLNHHQIFDTHYKKTSVYKNLSIMTVTAKWLENDYFAVIVDKKWLLQSLWTSHMYPCSFCSDYRQVEKSKLLCL